MRVRTEKNVDCFLDGHGNYDDNLVCFRIISSYTNHFMISKEIYIIQLVVEMIKSSHPSRTRLP